MMRQIAEFVAVLSCSLFTGAAVYITFIEHPARMQCGVEIAATEFAPSYRRATVMQATCAAFGLLSSIAAWAIRRFIDERMEAGFSVIELADIVGLRPQRFAQKVRMASGLSPWRFVQAHRISGARNMLRNERTPIVEISNSLGFASQSHFTNAFRDNLGVTPKAYRNMLR